MKTILFFILISGFAFGQNNLFYTEIYDVPGVSKEKLFERVSNHLIKSYEGEFQYKKNILQSDLSQNVIKVKMTKRYFVDKGFWKGEPDKGYVDYVASYYFKDGRVKIELSNFEHRHPGYSVGLITDDKIYPYKTIAKKQAQKFWEETKVFINGFYPESLLTLSSYAKTQSENEKTDW